MEPQPQQRGDNNKKKTRDLPDISECHSCGSRHNSGSGALHTLYSEWRIVLLCKICFDAVESSTVCSYCFKSSTHHGNCFKCDQCKRIIHKSCFSNYAPLAPCSFSSQFTVCFDCWLPQSIAAKRASKRNKKKRNDSALVDFGDCGEKLLEDANCLMERKTVAAARARELAVEKARKAAELARNAFNLVVAAKRHDNIVVDDSDLELALRLHCVLNSSPRVFKNLCLVSSHCSAVAPNTFVRTGFCRKLEVSSMNMDSFGLNKIDDIWIRPNAKDTHLDAQLKEGEGSCSGKLIDADYHWSREGDLPLPPADNRLNVIPSRFLIKYSRRKRADERNYGKRDPYLIKYARKTPADKRYGKGDPYFDKVCKENTHNEICNGKRNRCLIKYARRKLNQRSIIVSGLSCSCEDLHHKNQSSAVGLTLSCSKESMTSSSASLLACPFAAQRSASSSDLSRDQS